MTKYTVIYVVENDVLWRFMNVKRSMAMLPKMRAMQHIRGVKFSG